MSFVTSESKYFKIHIMMMCAIHIIIVNSLIFILECIQIIENLLSSDNFLILNNYFQRHFTVLLLKLALYYNIARKPKIIHVDCR